MRAIGELVLSDTSKSSFIEFVRAYLGDRFEFDAAAVAAVGVL